MAFEPYIESGNFRYQECGWLGSAAIVKGSLVRFDLSTGYIEPATVSASAATDGSVFGVNMGETQTASSTNGATKTQIVVLQPGQVWKVDTTGDIAQTMVGTAVSLTNAASLDEDDTANWPTWHIVGYVGALTDRKALATPIFAQPATGLASGITAIGV